MGMNTQGFFDSKIKTDDIVEVLKYKFNVDCRVEETGSKGYLQVFFEYKDEKRILSVFENYTDKSHTGEDATTLIDLNVWGSSVEIIRGIVEEFGGYLDENDYGSEGWKYINKVNITQPLGGKRISESVWREQYRILLE